MKTYMCPLWLLRSLVPGGSTAIVLTHPAFQTLLQSLTVQFSTSAFQTNVFVADSDALGPYSILPFPFLRFFKEIYLNEGIGELINLSLSPTLNPYMPNNIRVTLLKVTSFEQN